MAMIQSLLNRRRAERARREVAAYVPRCQLPTLGSRCRRSDSNHCDVTV